MEGSAEVASQEIITALAEKIRRIERGLDDEGPAFAGVPSLSTGWEPIDALLRGGLPRGAVHEWMVGEGIRGQGSGDRRQETGRNKGQSPRTPVRGVTRGVWCAPLCLFAHIARRAIKECETPDRCVTWIGRRCWPHGYTLVGQETGDRRQEAGARNQKDSGLRTQDSGLRIQDSALRTSLLSRSLFIDPPDRAARLWAIELSLRSPAVALVIADGSLLDMSATRKLQLAAEAGLRAGAGGIALLARPPHEQGEISAAVTRWTVCAEGNRRQETGDRSRQQAAGSGCSPSPVSCLLSPSPSRPRWRLQLARCRSGQIQTTPAFDTGWTLEWNHETSTVAVPADVVDRSRAEKVAHRA
ncbi:MAG: hypothetical protein WD768_06670 [Phycisphaeraceae bacterium]